MTKTIYPTIDEKIKNSIEELRLTQEEMSRPEITEHYAEILGDSGRYQVSIGYLSHLYNGLVCAIIYDQARKYLNSGRSLDDFKQDWGMTPFLTGGIRKNKSLDYIQNETSDFEPENTRRYAVGFNAKKLCELVYIPEIAYRSIPISYSEMDDEVVEQKVTKTSDYTHFYLWGSANAIEHIEIIRAMEWKKGKKDLVKSTHGISNIAHKLESNPNPITKEFLEEGVRLGKGMVKLYAEDYRSRTQPGYKGPNAPKKPELVNALLDYYERVIESI